MMTLQKAEKRLEEEYEKAKKLEWVHNPIAYALYHVWKEADRDGDEMKKKNSCPFCNEPIYIKRVQYSAPLLAPMTEAQVLRDRLTELTGEVYVLLEKRFCPACGRNLRR